MYDQYVKYQLNNKLSKIKYNPFKSDISSLGLDSLNNLHIIFI